jgi:8-oxo-dGTP diphosphatase
MREVHVVGAAIIDGRLCLAAQRGPAMRLPGKWEFPGGKVEPGEPPAAALEREIREELGLDIAVGELLATGRARDADLLIVLDVYLATLRGGTLRLHEHASARWLGADQLAALDWADADLPALTALARHLATRERAS